MKKQLNPLQPLIDELHQNKKLHSQLAKNAESERQSVENGYANFEKGVAYGFELAIEILAKFQFWNDARTNPPKFDKNRKYPYLAGFMCVVKHSGQYFIWEETYDFIENKWFSSQSEVLYWQEYPVMPKELLE